MNSNLALLDVKFHRRNGQNMGTFVHLDQLPAEILKGSAIACFVLVRLRSPEGHTWKLDGVSIENNI